MDSVRNFVKDFTKKKSRLNLLVNNAGMALNFKDLTRKTTRQGFEVTMATNHFGMFKSVN
jgi:NAD(P)-dependent dehydrogenase (short-subunit alcohol dehydrogenase family)